ncbi:MAG: hypothetical protein ACM3ZE_06600 [Myxococcales bacterium]
MEPLALTVIAAAVVTQLFVEPIVGMADNRDYYRVMRQIGVHYLDNPELTVFRNIQRTFALGPISEVNYFTSAVPLGKLAGWLSRPLSPDGRFDIRMMGLVHSIFYLGAVAIFLCAFRRRSASIRVVVACASAALFSDVRLVSYFNSFFSEGAQLIFLIFTVGLSLLLCRPARVHRAGALYLAWYGSALLFCLAKTQDIIFCFPFSLLAFRFLPRGRLPTWVRACAGAGFLALFVWTIVSDAYLDTRHMNLHVVLHEEILVHSPNPQADVEELALDGAQADGFLNIVRFCLRHSDRWFELLHRRMSMTFDYIPFGNFELPKTGVSHSFDLWSEWKRKHYPRSIYFGATALVSYLGILAYKSRRIGVLRRDRNDSLFHALLALSCLAEFSVVGTFEANGPQKHFFIFNVLVDIVCLLAVADVLSIARRDFGNAWIPTEFLSTQFRHRVRANG